MESRYLSIDVRTAPPGALVSRLLARAVQSARDAQHAPAGADRTRRLARSLDILSELRRSLNFEAGGEIARNLDRLYEFAAERLVRAGVSGADREIEEALKALEPIAEAFGEISSSARLEAQP